MESLHCISSGSGRFFGRGNTSHSIGFHHAGEVHDPWRLSPKRKVIFSLSGLEQGFISHRQTGMYIGLCTTKGTKQYSQSLWKWQDVCELALHLFQVVGPSWIIHAPAKEQSASTTILQTMTCLFSSFMSHRANGQAIASSFTRRWR